MLSRDLPPIRHVTPCVSVHKNWAIHVNIRAEPTWYINVGKDTRRNQVVAEGCSAANARQSIIVATICGLIIRSSLRWRRRNFTAEKEI